jgi:hypothetical protein
MGESIGLGVPANPKQHAANKLKKRSSKRQSSFSNSAVTRKRLLMTSLRRRGLASAHSTFTLLTSVNSFLLFLIAFQMSYTRIFLMALSLSISLILT